MLILPIVAIAQTTPAAVDAVASPYQEKDFVKEVKLQGLNKVTARVSSFNVKEGQIGKFGNLEISLLKCWQAPPEEEPESKALLKIWEQVPGEDKKEIFQGWMFASSPTISAIQHPVYEITVLECVGEPPVAAAAEEKPTTPEKAVVEDKAPKKKE